MAYPGYGNPAAAPGYGWGQGAYPQQPAYPPSGPAYPPQGPAYPQQQKPKPIINPALPYIGQIRNGMRPGKMISIQGVVPRNADRFHFNLQVGASTKPRADVAFHLAVRMKEGVIVRNTLENEKWQTEERAVTCFPFKAGENFELLILAEKENYKIAVNGKHFVEYKHRMKPLKKIDTLHIYGDVTIKSINLPEEQTAGAHSVPQPVPGTITNPTLPYSVSIPGGMYPGRMIFLTGSIIPQPDRFHVNLTPGDQVGGNTNIAFHFAARFPNKVIVCNTMQNKKWGAEERNAPYFPFEPSTNFEIIILCQQDSYKVAVNGRHLIEYRHRTPFQNVTFLAIGGSACRISQIRFQ
ncbi:galectin-8-like [Ptychodera flava]|uniref:galectin-8-like n=1 Tax=Ptychodera flava TaxID=63121 RepID=UPI003969D676